MQILKMPLKWPNQNECGIKTSMGRYQKITISKPAKQKRKHEWKKKPVALNTSQYEHNSMDRDSERGKGKKRKHEVESL